MGFLLYPDAYVDSVFEIDYKALYDRGIRGLLFDIDNTLVPHGADATPEIEALLRQLQQMGFSLFMLSNNGKERIERFLTNIPAQYLDNAGKPRPRGYRTALQMLGLKKSQALVIGDQLFTDVLGANLCGISSILVAYIGHETERPPGKRRAVEAWVLRRWQKRPRR